MVSFFVPGLPQPGGSKRAFVIKGRAIVTEDNKRSKDWRAVVSLAAADYFNGPQSGAVVLEVEFRLPRPKGHSGARGLRPSAPEHHTTKPDATKLLRSTEDALKGIAWFDDSQVTRQLVAKRYCEPGEGPGALIRVGLAPSADRAAVRPAVGAEEHPPSACHGAGDEADVAASPRSQPSPRVVGEGWLFEQEGE